MSDFTYKQVILVRQDLKLPKGKLSAQVAHASVEAVLRSDKKLVTAWRNEGMAKIVLKAKDEKELLSFLQQAKDADLTTALITDAGKTVIAPGTRTCLGIGPDIAGKIDALTGKLPLQ
ncbi:peptidyl-tRNA hydrolase [Candidatus Woesearchaeota archaeon]|nr:peptidyl-tRNA hydrolase [Candidatus Woesearchaeota archaeon]